MSRSLTPAQRSKMARSAAAPQWGKKTAGRTPKAEQQREERRERTPGNHGDTNADEN